MSETSADPVFSIVLNESPVALRLREIADSVAMESSRAMYWLDAMLAQKPVEPMARAVAALNAGIEPHVDEIAKLTNNAPGALRDAFAPKPDQPLMQWFRSVSATEFLRCVAQYESFNIRAWKDKGWQGFGRHEELGDEPALRRRAALSLKERDAGVVEVFHWNVHERLHNRQLDRPMQDMIYSLMRGKREIIVDTLADSGHWADLGLTWRKVADVDGTDLGRAFQDTNHIDHDWAENTTVSLSGATAPDQQARSTSVGDLMRVGDRLLVVASMGFEEVPGPASLWLDAACEMGKPTRKPRP